MEEGELKSLGQRAVRGQWRAATQAMTEDLQDTETQKAYKKCETTGHNADPGGHPLMHEEGGRAETEAVIDYRNPVAKKLILWRWDGG